MNQTTAMQNPIERYYDRLRELTSRDPQLQALVPKASVREASRQPGLSNAQIIAAVLDGYADRPALGERRYQIAIDPETGLEARSYLPSYSTITYQELRDRVVALAAAWQHHERHRVAADEFVCVLGFNGIDFTTIELAAAFAQVATVPLQTSMAREQLEEIFRDTATPMLVATVNDLDLAATMAINAGGIRSLVAMDYDPQVAAERQIFEAAQARIRQAGAAVSLTTLAELIAFGRPLAWEAPPPHKQGAERLAALIHSSGSTGTPKGVMIPERMINLAWLGGLEQMPTITTVFAPMNHFMGRHQVFTTLAPGGTAYFTAKHDLTLLFEDIRLSRPTFLTFYPRIFELIYQHYQSEVVRRSGEGGDAAAVEAEIRADMGASFLGDRLRAGTIGSAPVAPEVKQFISDCFDILLIEGYGSTESGIMVTMGERVLRPPVIDYKLKDVPELGYYSTDKPYPRGELCVKSMLQSPGYFKRPEATAALFDADGYVLTGDIMEQRGPDHIVYVDRRNDVLKLSQAEFVAVGALGAAFEGGSAVIRQIYIYGNSARAYLLAVVVPDNDVVANKLGPAPAEHELKALIRAELQRVARDARLRSFEVPRDFIIESEPFSFENGLLTSVRKRSRPNLKQKYGERLETLYGEIERKRSEELTALKDPNSPLTVLQKVVKALEASLGIEGIDPETRLTFAELGGDSLGTVSFSMFIEDIFGVELPVNAIISPAGHPRRWAQLIAARLGTAVPAAPTFASIHGKEARTLHARDLMIDRFLERRTLDNVPSAPPADTATVLLTGANGFLGSFLCLGWMEQLAKETTTGGKLICLIRASNDAAARERLDAVFCGKDEALERHYRTLAASHLEVLAGDLAEPGFGLPPGQWERLAEEVDHIVHPAALVNHVLGYEHLFGPNVLGTAELIRLALTRRQKRFDFVSSMAVAYRLDTALTAGRADESSPPMQTLALGDGYADGYGASKWAAEVLLQDVHRRFGLPINIFRGDMIMPHRTYKGQINVPDMLTRLLYSIVMTELAPESFYQSGGDGRRAHAHYDGLPVDFLAGAMVGIGAQAHREIRTFNTINHHVDDGISLDTLVDWIATAGYAVERIRDHHRWLTRFEDKLRTLTEAQRQHSSLAILQQFRQPLPATEPDIGSANFVAAVRNLAIGPEVPHLTEDYIHKYLDDMRRLGLLPEPHRKIVSAV